MSLHLGAQFVDLVGELSIHLNATWLRHGLPQPVKHPIEGLAEAAAIGLVSGVKVTWNFHACYSRDGGVDVVMTQPNHRPIRRHDKGPGTLAPFAVSARVDDNDPPSVRPRRHCDDVTRVKSRQRIGDLARAFTFAQSRLLVLQLPDIFPQPCVFGEVPFPTVGRSEVGVDLGLGLSVTNR